jgi:hypothetical protein
VFLCAHARAWPEIVCVETSYSNNKSFKCIGYRKRKLIHNLPVCPKILNFKIFVLKKMSMEVCHCKQNESEIYIVW